MRVGARVMGVLLKGGGARLRAGVVLAPWGAGWSGGQAVVRSFAVDGESRGRGPGQRHMRLLDTRWRSTWRRRVSNTEGVVDMMETITASY